MKILIVRDRESAGGGIFNYYHALAPYFKLQVRFLGIGRPHDCYGVGKEFLYRFTPVRLFLEWVTLALQIMIYRPQIVHVNPGLDVKSFRSLRRDAISVLIAKAFRRKVVVFWRGWHNSWLGEKTFPGGNNGWVCRAYKKASVQIVLASRFKNDLRSWGFAMPIYVETTVASDSCLNAKTSTGPSNGYINLLYLSRIEIAKGVFELLDAYKILKEKNARYQLTIAGDGPDLEDLKAYAKEIGLEDVCFPGFVSGDTKTACYQEGSLFCFPSYTEGMPNAVLEALAFGLPVVASEAGGLKDILQEGKTGARLELLEGTPKKRFDVTKVAEAINQLVSNDGLCRQITEHNISYARKRFAAPKVAARLETIYEETFLGKDSNALIDKKELSD